MPNSRMTPQMIDEAVSLLGDGFGLEEIAQKLGVTKNIVRYWTDPEYREGIIQRNQDYRKRTRLARRAWGVAHRSRCPEAHLLTRAKHRAKEQGIEFDLTIEDIVIPDRCPYLDIPIVNGAGTGVMNPRNTASLDRINPDKGYVRGNVIVVSYLANAVKQNLHPMELVRLGQRIEKLIQSDPRFDTQRRNNY